MKCVTGDGVEVGEGATVWLYPADGIVGGTIEPVVVGEVLSPQKFLYPEPDAQGYEGARAGSTYSTREAAEAARAKERQDEHGGL